MNSINLLDYSNVSFGKGVKIVGDDVFIGDGAVIEDNVEIFAKKIHIGRGAKIEKETIIRGLGSTMNEFFLGDNAFIGFRNQILVPFFRMLDYSQLHNSGLNSGYKPLTIGYNCWIGQGTILNSTETLTIDNNVRIGTNSQLWTHVASGELLEGCTLYGNKELHLKDNVWIVGGAVISPGLKLEKNSIVMTGSVLTKDTEAFSTYAGIPAKDVTNKLSFWKSVTLKDKVALIEKFIEEFYNLYPHYKGKVILLDEVFDDSFSSDDEVIYVVKKVDLSSYLSINKSIFDLSSKKYLKTRVKIEIDWIKFNIGYRARFIPYN